MKRKSAETQFASELKKSFAKYRIDYGIYHENLSELSSFVRHKAKFIADI